ncbi:hypothetical protein HWV62_26130 [Athelia sp. TMB]|nr:hypothetical protein HWV62_26130 [Athelia sp. TMB]
MLRIVDLHSHLGVQAAPLVGNLCYTDDLFMYLAPLPQLRGIEDGNSLKGPILPWLRSIDGLNTHDEAFSLAAAGGVTTSLILPGSANAVGGQGFVMKTRPTPERTPTSFLLEPPYNLNGSQTDYSMRPRWRHMKYETARKIKESQDAYCRKVSDGIWEQLGPFPDDLEYEAVVDILRGKVKVQTHCYEAVDIDNFVRLSNEFKFPVAAFHHAHEAYLVPDVLKRAYENVPAIAMFATFARYKRESYRSSEFAARILADEGIKVVMKARNIPFERHVMMLVCFHIYIDWGQVYIEDPLSSDIVIWDSHPLALGATPSQVFIDGIPQLSYRGTPNETTSARPSPKTPNFDVEAALAVKYNGLPPLSHRSHAGLVIFRNITGVWTRTEDGIKSLIQSLTGSAVAVVDKGVVICVEIGQERCSSHLESRLDKLDIDLKGGTLSPALVSFGPSLGLDAIAMEPSATDGAVDDILGPIHGLAAATDLVKASDGLQFGTRDALLAYRAGVSTSITAPISAGFMAGLSSHFSLVSTHKLEQGAVIKDVAAIHIAISSSHSASGVLEGHLTLVCAVDTLDIMATLMQLKHETELQNGGKIMKWTFSGASEAHLLAEELAAANVGVIVQPRPYPYGWEQRRL